MNRWIKTLIIPLLILIVAYIAGKALMANKAPPQPKAIKEFKPVVEAITVKPQDYQFTVNSQSTVQPENTYLVNSEVNARVDSVANHYKNGSKVSAGEVLIKLENTNYKLAVAQAEAGLADADINLRNEQAEIARAKKLSTKAATARQQRLLQVQASQKTAQLQLQKAKEDLSKTRIAAPVNGIIDNIQIDEGQFVNVGSPLFTLLATDTAEIRLPITAEDLAFLDIPENGEQGRAATVYSMFGNVKRSWRGYISRVEKRVDNSTRVFYLIVSVDQPYNTTLHDSPLWFGLFVQVSLEGRKASDLYILPSQSVYEDRYVYIIRDNHLQRRNVDILRREGDKVIANGGLQSGDKVMSSRLDLIVDGMAVTLSDSGSSTNKDVREIETINISPLSQ